MRGFKFFFLEEVETAGYLVFSYQSLPKSCLRNESRFRPVLGHSLLCIPPRKHLVESYVTQSSSKSMSSSKSHMITENKVRYQLLVKRRNNDPIFLHQHYLVQPDLFPPDNSPFSFPSRSFLLLFARGINKGSSS